MAGFILPQMFLSVGFSYLFGGQAFDTNNANIYTFAGADLKTVAATRKILVGVCGGNSALAVNAMTVGGVSASLVSGSNIIGSGISSIEFWIADVPTGATGDIVVDWAGAAVQDRTAIAWWALYNASGTRHDAQTDSASPFSVSLNVPANGAGFAMLYELNVSSATWTGLDEEFEQTMEGTTGFTAASKSFAAAQTGLTVACTYSASSSAAVFSAVSFGPA